MTSRAHNYTVTPSLYVLLFLTVAISLPGAICGMLDIEISPQLGSLLFGIAIFGAAFILSWAAEAVQIDISESLAIVILALLAVLPEYAIDFVFTWKAAHDPEQAHFAIANMTGANRLLVGLGWPLVLMLAVFFRKAKEIVLDESQRVEIFYLAMATLYSFTIPLKGSLNLFDTLILVTLFGMYTRRAAQLESPEPEIVGPPKIICNLPTRQRRIATYTMFAFAGAVIFFVSEPFAMSLVAMGADLGIDQFLLVQWLAPIASESPEFIIAATWTLRGSSGSAIRALISSKVNQWTLLVGTIPLVYAISGRVIRPFPLDTFQSHELYLTAAQSLFGVAVLVNLKLNKTSGALLLILFLSQLIFESIRLEVAAVYIALAVVYHVLHRKELIPAMKMGLDFKKKLAG